MAPSSHRSERGGAFQTLSQNEADSSADETTGIVDSQPSRNYQATQTIPNPRSRKRAQNQQGDPQPRADDNADTSTNGHTNGTANGQNSRWKDYLEGFWSIELENKGSVARDHLALERTFLAWLRTSLAFASIGIAITQLFRLNTAIGGGPNSPSYETLRHLGKPLGATFLAISILVLFLGYQRYFQSQHWILKGKFPASRGTVIVISLIAFMLMIASLVVVVVVQPQAR